MSLRNAFFFGAGIVFLGLAKAKNVLRGYSTPRPFDHSDTERNVAYDIKVVDQWLVHLASYTGTRADLTGKNVLELGPGSDLGIGLLLLAKGAARYNAYDVNDLARSAPDAFYQALFRSLKSIDAGADIQRLAGSLHSLVSGAAGELNYVVRGDFDLVAAFGRSTIDLIFSQAAFEHFDDLEATIAGLSAVCKPGAVIVAEIDLQTHSRWIRTKDPNNIYRYPPALYNLFRFRGSPNRVRPYRYRELFQRHGWTNVLSTALTSLDGHSNGMSGLSRRFADGVNQMDQLTVLLCATKSPAS
jgi:SAM-dependent methyltransferase